MTSPLNPEPTGSEQPPVMLYNGTVHSITECYAEAMLVEAGRVAWLGSDETAERLAEESMHQQDLDRALVTPGFVGAVSISLEEATSGSLAETLDTAARDRGCTALWVRLQVPARLLSTEQSQGELTGTLRQALRTVHSHPVDVYPVLQLSGLAADGGAPSISPINSALDLLGDLDPESTQPIALQLEFNQVAANLLGVRSWCSEAGRQLLLDCTQADPGTVTETVVTSQQRLRELKQTPSPAAPTVLVDFDSAQTHHWEALLNTAVHVQLTAPGHLATALRVGVPTSAASGQDQNPWQLVCDHVYHDDDPVSVRAGFNAQTRAAYRSLVGAHPEDGQLNPGSVASYTVWEVDQLAVQTPNATAAAWSTDTRARTPLLPYLDGETLPRLVSTVVSGHSL